jgi:hypothetical protein
MLFQGDIEAEKNHLTELRKTQKDEQQSLYKLNKAIEDLQHEVPNFYSLLKQTTQLLINI